MKIQNVICFLIGLAFIVIGLIVFILYHGINFFGLVISVGSFTMGLTIIISLLPDENLKVNNNESKM